MASPYQPDVLVEIAFNAGYNTPPGSRTWTDVSQYVEPGKDAIKVDYGRSDEFATTDANTLTLTLDNRDGRFTPGRASSPYYPNVKIGRPIRVTATPVSGAPSVRFTGYVDEWPIAWDGSEGVCWSPLKASSRMARLGFNAELQSIVEEAILVDDPVAYYTLGEPEGAQSAADQGSATFGPLSVLGSKAPLVFGTAIGPPTDDLTAVQLNSAGIPGAQYLATTQDGGVYTGGGAPQCSMEVFFVIGPGSPPDQAPLFFWENTATDSSTLGLFVDAATGSLVGGQSEYGNVNLVYTPSSVCDGRLHHAVVTLNSAATRIDLYLDGVLVGSDTTVTDGNSATPQHRLLVGRWTINDQYYRTTATIAHAALYDYQLSAAQVIAHAAAGFTGYQGETAGARIRRLASYASIPSAEVSTPDTTYPVDFSNTTGASAMDAMRKVEATEGGVLYDARDNTLTLRGRVARYNTASAFTLSMALHQVEADVSPTLDRTQLINDATATATDGSTARAYNQASINDYGYARTSIEVLASNDAAYQAASWLVYLYSTPSPRIPALSVDLLPLPLATQQLLLSADIGTRFTVSSLPTQAAASTMDFFIEGYTETIGSASYSITFNVSPVTGFDVFALDDPVRGVLDSTYPLAY